MFVLLFQSFVIATNFNDVPADAWYKDSMNTLVSSKIIDGYTDGTFRPLSSLQVDHFIKMTVTALGHTNIQNGDGYWASTYIDKAKELNLVQDGEFTGYTRAITRYEMVLYAS